VDRDKVCGQRKQQLVNLLVNLSLVNLLVINWLYASNAGKAGDGNTAAFTMGVAAETTQTVRSLQVREGQLTLILGIFFAQIFKRTGHLGTITGRNQILFSIYLTPILSERPSAKLPSVCSKTLPPA